MADMPTLETPRLILRPVRLDDAPAIQRIFPRWEIVRHLDAGIPWPYPDDGADAYLRGHLLPAIERGEAWSWAILPRDDAAARLIGCIDLSLLDGAHRGFWLDPAWQGRGLMSEAAEAVTDHWFGPLGQPVMRIHKAIANEASRRISLRQGMRCIATMEKDYVGGRLPSELWEITAREWRARPRRP